MDDRSLFEGFDEKAYAEEARQRWGSDPSYAESQRRWRAYTAAEKKAIQEEGARLMVNMVDRPDDSPDAEHVQQAVAAYHAYIERYFYPCSYARLVALSVMWEHDPRFREVFERVRDGGAAFVRQAVARYCESR
ncbi:MAG: hypothetical protein Fur0018_08500 [Anaerolineales bacterium]